MQTVQKITDVKRYYSIKSGFFLTSTKACCSYKYHRIYKLNQVSNNLTTIKKPWAMLWVFLLV